MLAETHNFVGLAAHVTGPVDIDLLSEAYEALLEAHPILTGRIEQLPDGRHQVVTDDPMPDPVEVIELAGPDAPPPAPHVDQTESLVALRVILRDGQAQRTLDVHHAVADGPALPALIGEMLSYYTGLVTTGRIGAINVEPAPQSIGAVLAARDIEKQQRSGIERFMPALFAYDLPP